MLNAKLYAVSAFLLFAIPTAALAQASASINGRVVDSADAVIPNASVTITNLATGVPRNSATNAGGLYNVPALTPGTYSVKVEAQGFGTEQRNNVELLTGANLSVDFKLQVGTVQQTVEVAATAAAIETTQSVGSATIQQSEVDSLPMVNRSMSSLMVLLPGAREVAASTPSRNNVSVGGGIGDNFNTVVDGADDKEDHNGGTVMTYSLDGIQEFRTLTTGANAEYGRGVAQILVTTKSGTNSMHGSAFGYYRNQDLERTDYFSDPQHGGLGKPPLSHQQWGGSMGGAIIRDKLFYFGSAERDAQDYSIPVSPALLAQQQLLLFLNNTTGYTHNYIKVNPYDYTPNHEWLAQGKLNYTLSPKHSLYARYASEIGALYYGSGSSAQTGLTVSPYQTVNYQTLFSVTLGDTYVINPSTVNQFTVQWQQYSHDNRYNTCPMNIPELGVDSCLGDALSFAGGVGTSFLAAFPDYTNWEHKWQFKDDFSKQIGRHALKFGFDDAYIPMFGGLLAVFGPGTITFNKSPAAILALPDGFQTPGIVSNLVEWSGINGDYSTPTSWETAVYAQDDYKISPTLTLNLGVRWDANNLGFDSQANRALNPTYQILKAIGSPYGAQPKLPNWKNFAPRLGVAWDIGGKGKNVVRASYGLFYLTQLKIANYAQDVLQKAHPFVQSQLGPAQLANFIFGVTPLPPINAAPTSFAPASNATGYWYDPNNMKDATSQQFHGGLAHSFSSKDVFTVDFTYNLLHHGWRWIDVNPLIGGVRPLAAATQALYGDSKLLGPVLLDSGNMKAIYWETAFHFEHHFSTRAQFQINYVLASSYAFGGVGDGGVGASSTGGGAAYPQIPTATGGLLAAPWEWGPTNVDERHRITATGIFNVPFKIELAPSLTWGSARPYTLVSGPNPSGDGNRQLLDANGNPIGVNTQRGSALFNVNMRVTRTFPIRGERLKMQVFGELYNLTDRANFGNVYGGTLGTPTFEKPTGYLGGTGATSNIPVSFQVQFGGRFTF